MAKDIPTAALDPNVGWHPNADSAALQAAKGVSKGAESAGVLYQNKADSQFSASNLVGQGERDAFALRAKVQPGHTLAGIFHNHPGEDDNGQVFSPRDIQVAEQLKVPSYVYFEKTGQLRKYVPGQTVTRTVPDPLSPRNRIKVADGDPITQPKEDATFSEVSVGGGAPVRQVYPAAPPSRPEKDEPPLTQVTVTGQELHTPRAAILGRLQLLQQKAQQAQQAAAAIAPGP